MKLSIISALLLLGQVAAVWDPFAAKFDLYKADNDEVSIETDYHLGYEMGHHGKSSDYQELRDQLYTSINFKQWLKINIRIRDVFIHSNVIEWTWFDLQPIAGHYFLKEPEDWYETLQWIQNFDINEVDAHIAFSYFVDFFSFKTYTIEYPTYCTVDLAMLIGATKYFECGYNGDQYRMSPMYAQDPNW